ncbi:hypothetical protein, partial [Heyndrickxia ginsengihumi]|uniref:hypothetical protein n=1 Tax=Heyndrickxia ginsengihumi TaxID=363870 RepID=UPI003D1F51D6
RSHVNISVDLTAFIRVQLHVNDLIHLCSRSDRISALRLCNRTAYTMYKILHNSCRNYMNPPMFQT